LPYGKKTHKAPLIVILTELLYQHACCTIKVIKTYVLQAWIHSIK